MKKTDDKKYTIEHVYLGERVREFTRGTHQLFRDKNGEVAFFHGIRGVVPGESYLVSPEGTIKVKNPPQPKNQTIFLTDEDWLQYEIQKELVKDYRLRRKKIADLKKPHPDIVKAINLLRPFARYMDSIDLSRFASYLTNQLSKKEKK